ncbi:M12 family metallo-peptidase [Cupriavidus pauculus]|nr:M12 family metallo-peptidase [Cupriavidus pauculus]
MAQLAIAESNQGFENSKIKIRFELAGTYVVKNYTETGSYSTELSRARVKGDGYMDDLHTVRANTSANIVVVLLNSREYCGMAYVKANAASAFATVGRNCATGVLTFAHEIGHLLGATHNNEISTNPNFPYGYGTIVPGKWRTVMAYECTSGGSCPRINFWSSPNVFYQGRATGDSLHDNARVLNERRETAATWR